MRYFTKQYEGAMAEVAVFEYGRRQAHAIIHSDAPLRGFDKQIASIETAIASLADELGMRACTARYFLTDIANQLQAASRAIAKDLLPLRSFIQQAPLDGSKVAVWVVFEQDADYAPNADSGLWADSRGRVIGAICPDFETGDSYVMTRMYLENLEDALRARGGSLLKNCLRTWFFVRDIDQNYNGVVQARNEVFRQLGFDDYYIASTGIEGKPGTPGATVEFEAVADLNLRPGQMTHLKGSTHLNPTREYGVAFERGTCVDYSDRRIIFISGTASIDNRGEIVHPGDIEGQTLRMLENIEVLLREGEAGWADVAHLIVYLRDISDYPLVNALINKRLKDIPKVIVEAPVCRPGWLIEAECIAIKARASHYEAF